jgi:transcriptional regulator with XRE-family HTH domain
VRDLPDDDTWLADLARGTGDRIRSERLHQNLTQDDVYLAAGIARWTYQRAESGEEITVSTLRRIAWVLDVPLAYLLADEEDPAHPPRG